MNEPDCCQSCIGTGIGWNGPESKCWHCHGTGVVKPELRFADEDPWAFNHFPPEPGDEDIQDPLRAREQTAIGIPASTTHQPKEDGLG